MRSSCTGHLHFFGAAENENGTFMKKQHVRGKSFASCMSNMLD